jgi:hypothetical protein
MYTKGGGEKKEISRALKFFQKKYEKEISKSFFFCLLLLLLLYDENLSGSF